MDDYPKTYSLETDYKVKGNESKLLLGVWMLTNINDIEILATDNILMEFKSNSELIFQIMRVFSIRAAGNFQKIPKKRNK